MDEERFLFFRRTFTLVAALALLQLVREGAAAAFGPESVMAQAVGEVVWGLNAPLMAALILCAVGYVSMDGLFRQVRRDSELDRLHSLLNRVVYPLVDLPWRGRRDV